MSDCIGPTNIIPNNNQVNLQDVNRTITVIDNNCCTQVDVTQPITSVVQILTGPIGPKGEFPTSGSISFTGSFDVSGSISSNIIYSPYFTGSFYGNGNGIFSGSFSGSISSNLQDVTNNGNVTTLPITASSFYGNGLQIVGDATITGSLTISGSNTFRNIGPAQFTGSTDITGSLSVNGVDYEFTSASFDQRIKNNSSSISLLSGSYLIDSSSFSTRISDLEQFSSSLDNTFATDAELNAATASLSSSIALLSSSYEQFSSSYNTGSFTGSFIGDFLGSRLDGSNYGYSEVYYQSASIYGYVGVFPSYTFNTFFDGTNLNELQVYGDKSVFLRPIEAPSLTGSLQGTASWADNATSSSYAFDATSASYSSTSTSASHALIAVSSSYALSASHALNADYAISSSYALTASYINPLYQDVVLTGSLLITQSHISTVDYIDFNPNVSNPGFLTGRVHWTDDTKTIQIDTDVANFEIEVGHQSVVRGRNTTGYTLTKGMVVYINGESGNRPTFTTASWQGDPSSASTLGFVAQDINDSQTGYVVTNGILRGLNTTAFAPGTQLYLSSSGQYTSTVPISPNHEVRLGKTITQATNGYIYVDIMNGYELEELHDVLIVSRSNGDLISWDSGSRVWRNTKVLSGSYSLSGSLTTNDGVSVQSLTASFISASNITGSLFGTASYAITANTASYVLQAVSSSFTSTASYINTLNQNVLISGSLTILNGATIYGSSSFQYVTSSQLAVSASTISVNIFEPAERFGGLVVYDSGSSNATASFLWDSLHNHFIYQNVSGAAYAGGMFLAGPRNTGSLGDEPTLNKWFIPRSDGGDHLDNSQIYSSGSITQITGSLTITQGITGSLQGTSSWANNAVTASYYGGNVISASYASTASYILNSISSSFSSTASYVTTAQTASYVQTAQTASYVLNAVSSSFSTTSSFALTASYVANASSFPFTGSAIISGSLTVTGSSNLPSITGSLLGTSSYASQALSSSYALTASYALNAAAASSFPYTGSAIISGSLSVIGPTSITGSLAVSSSATGSIFSVSASYIDFDFDSFLFSGSTTFQGSLDATNATSSFGTVTATNARLTGSIFGSSSYALTASYALNAGGGGGFPYTGSAIITGSLTIIGRNTLTGSFTASNSESIDYLNQTLFHPATTGSRIYQSSIAPIFRTTAPNQTSTALRVNPTFTGSFTGSNTQNLIVDFGATNVGSQFTVNDITSGSIYMVNDISGLPIIEATSDWTVNIYDYPNVVLKKTGSLVQISGSLVVGGAVSASSLYTTTWMTSSVGNNIIFSNLPTSSYDGAWFEYTAKSGSNARAGQIMSIWSGSSVNFTETTTTQFGNTSGLAFTVIVTGSNIALTGSSTTSGWVIKTIIRSI